MSDGPAHLRAAIIIVSDTASQDPTADRCIPALQDVFVNGGGARFDAQETIIIPDDIIQIQKAITLRCDGDRPFNLIITSGGTGFATRDVTPEVCWAPMASMTNVRAYADFDIGSLSSSRPTRTRSCVS